MYDDESDVDVDHELAAARADILSGEYEEGVRHLALAATADPANADLEDLLWVVLDELGEAALDLAPPSGLGPAEDWARDAAVRAWFLNALGRVGEAVDLLLLVIGTGTTAQPQWSAWLVHWLAADPDLVIPPDALLAACRAAPATPGLVGVFERAIGAHKRHAALRTVGVDLALEAGRPAEAVKWATEADRLEPTVASATRLGHAHRAAGDERKALAAFESASRRDPSDPRPRLDASDTLYHLGDWAGSATWAQSAWDLDREDGAAAARALRARFRETGDPTVAYELFDWLDARTDEDGTGPDSLGDAVEVASAAAANLPWTGHLPLPTTAVVDLVDELRAVAEEQRRGRIKVALAAPESPSALLALSHAVGRTLAVTSRFVPDPDPREPRRPVRFLTWRVYEADVVQAVPPPSPRDVEAVRITPSRWYRLATAVQDGTRLAAASGTINDLVSLALYPPAGPATVSPWDWVRRWEVVCCIALAHRDALDVLCDFADGPEDWISDAALAGLVHLAGRREHLRPRIVDFATTHLVESYGRVGNVGVPYFGSECDLYVLLPGALDEEVQGARDLKRQWQEDQQ